MKLDFFSAKKTCDIQNQRPFFVFEIKIPQKWPIPLSPFFKLVLHAPTPSAVFVVGPHFSDYLGQPIS